MIGLIKIMVTLKIYLLSQMYGYVNILVYVIKIMVALKIYFHKFMFTYVYWFMLCTLTRADLKDALKYS